MRRDTSWIENTNIDSKEVNTVKRQLVFSFGNPSRGDDALGPLAAQAIEALALPDVECLTDFQLQIEHVLDLQGRDRVLFVDASCRAEPGDAAGYRVERLCPERDDSYTTHAMSPSALLRVFADTQGHPPPPAWLLTISGDSWELGDAPTAAASERLRRAVDWAAGWLAQAEVQA